MYNLLVVIRWPIGGIRTFCKYFYGNFDKNSFNITIMAPAIKESRELLEDLKALNPSFIPITKKGESLYKLTNLRIPGGLLRNGKFDLIHSHGLSAGLIFSVPAFLTGIPHIMTIHETLTADQFKGVNGRFLKAFFSSLLPLITGIHHVSFDAKNNLTENVPVLKAFPKKHVIIRNGIDIGQFLRARPVDFRCELDLPDNAFLIGFFGRFMPEKGFRYLIDTIEILSRESNLSKVPIVLAYGWGAFIREDQQFIQRKNLNRYFRFMPFTSNVASALKGLDVVVVPSLREACPLLPMEAMVCGVPIIGTECIGLREVLRDTCATIVPVKNSQSLAKAITDEMRNPSRIAAEKFIGQVSSRFDVKRQAVRLEEKMLALLKKPS